MNVDYAVARAALRVSLSASTTIEELRVFLFRLEEARSQSNLPI